MNVTNREGKKRRIANPSHRNTTPPHSRSILHVRTGRRWDLVGERLRGQLVRGDQLALDVELILCAQLDAEADAVAHLHLAWRRGAEGHCLLLAGVLLRWRRQLEWATAADCRFGERPVVDARAEG